MNPSEFPTPWRHNFIDGCGPLPSLFNSKRGTVAVLGCHHYLWDDLRSLRQMMRFIDEPLDVIATNDAGIHYSEVDHWVCLHLDIFPIMRQLRRAKRYPEVVTHSHGYRTRSMPEFLTSADVDCWWHTQISTGTVTLFATLVARLLGYDNVVLCGAPIEPGYRFYESSLALSEASFEQWRQAWIAAKDYNFAGRVRSMSGWTCKLLGGPNLDFVRFREERDEQGPSPAQAPLP